MRIKSLLFAALLFAFGQAAWAQQTLPFDEGFENGLNEWDFSGYWGQCTTRAAYEGSYSFRCQYPSGADYLISPMLLGTENGVVVTFYYTNYYEGASTFKVGYSTEEELDIDAIRWGDVIFADQGHVAGSAGSAGWQYYQCELPVGTTYFVVDFLEGNNVFLDDFHFTESPCAMPSTPVADEVTANAITLHWVGNRNDFELQHAVCMSSTFEQEPEDGNLDGWTSIDETWAWNQWDEDNDGFEWVIPHGGEGFIYSYDDNDNYLVSPLVPLGGSMTFFAMGEPEGGLKGVVHDERYFDVLVSTNGNDIEDFEVIMSDMAINIWNKFTVDLSDYSGMGYIAIRHNYCDDCDAGWLFIDDITILGEWTSTPVTGVTHTIEDLVPETTYAIQLRGVCDDDIYSAWSDMLMITTETENRFVANGYWCDEDNWSMGTLPTADSYVTIAADVIIPSGCVAEARTIVIEDGTITIEDGGQLKHDNTGVEVTVEKNISGYANVDSKNNYYLLGFPFLSSLNPSLVSNMVTTGNEFNYDLYYYDQIGDSEGKEWLNYKVDENINNFWFYPTAGFLYANSTTVTLSATGELNPSNEDFSSSLEYEEDADLPGWNLVSNPFMCNAYIGRDFYRLAFDDEELSAASGAIAPLEGIFVQATDEDDNEISFSRTEAQRSSGGILNVNITRKGNHIDLARVRFGEGRGLEKFQLNPNHTKVYIPMNDKDYAVVYAENNLGELPVSFKAEENGNYTMDFSTENVNFSYLHLIDNMTGKEVDLLQSPNYSFEAKTTDYTSRFKLVFASDSDVESNNFGFIHDGQLSILNNEGEAILQVMDINGRIISTETFSGSYEKQLNVASGVYMLRLINGNNVKVQKVVVR